MLGAMHTERTAWPTAMPQASHCGRVLGNPSDCCIGNANRENERQDIRARAQASAESGRIVCMIGHSASSQTSERIAYKREGTWLGAFTDAVIALAAACNVDVRFHPLAEY